MKKLSFFALSMLISVSICALFAGNAMSQESERSEVTEGAVCLDVVDLECTGADTNFPANVGKLYCITKITGAKGASKVTQVW